MFLSRAGGAQDTQSPMHLDRSGIREDGGESGREREGEEKTGEQHEGNAAKDEAERAVRRAGGQALVG